MDILASQWRSASSTGAPDGTVITGAYIGAVVVMGIGAGVMGAGAASGVHALGGSRGWETAMAGGGVVAGLGWSLLWVAIGMDIGAGAWSGATRSSFALSHDGGMLSVDGTF